MSEIPKIVLPHGGYKNLIVYKKSDVIYEGTVMFCRRFLPAYGDRTVDQMTQAARSCKQNIAEGSANSGISKETEFTLTGVARATLDELMEDYLDWLKTHNAELWSIDDERTKTTRDFAVRNLDWPAWKTMFETYPPDVLANMMLTLCHQTRYMLDKMIGRQEEDYKMNGGVRERMHAVRAAVRGEEWEKGLFSRLDSAATVKELDKTATELQSRIHQTVWRIKQRKGWI